MGSRRIGAAILVCAAVAGMACGKKGAPLAPFVRIPAPVDKIAATRLGTDVFVTVSVPGANIDGSLPADVSRVDIYGYTGAAAPARNRFADLGTLVASIPVTPAPLPAEPGVAPPPSRPPSLNPLPGAAATIRDQLTAEDFVQGPVDVDPRARPLPTTATVVPAPRVIRRFYLAIAFNTRGVPGPPGTAAELMLIADPDRPEGLRAAYTDTTLTLTWDPPGGLLGFLIDRPLPPEPLPFDVFGPIPTAVPDGSVPSGPTTFNVYRELAADPLVLPPPALPAWSAVVPAPVNPAPLAALSLTLPVDFGRPRCYVVRAARGATPPVLSSPSEPLCITPIDTFPPAAPLGVTAIASEGGISLLWEPNSDRDLGGYLVLRRGVGDATLRLLTDRPITDTRFRDTDVTAGTRYIYSVVAVDRLLPLPNLSVESAVAEETAR